MNVESALRDQLIDPAIQIAAAANDVLDGIESILPGGDAGISLRPCSRKKTRRVGLSTRRISRKRFQ